MDVRKCQTIKSACLSNGFVRNSFGMNCVNESISNVDWSTSWGHNMMMLDVRKLELCILHVYHRCRARFGWDNGCVDGSITRNSSIKCWRRRYAYIYIHTSIYICICMCAGACVCMCMCVYIYIYIYLYIHHIIIYDGRIYIYIYRKRGRDR